jgi:hypothetical protein
MVGASGIDGIRCCLGIDANNPQGDEDGVHDEREDWVPYVADVHRQLRQEDEHGKNADDQVELSVAICPKMSAGASETRQRPCGREKGSSYKLLQTIGIFTGL